MAAFLSRHRWRSASVFLFYHLSPHCQQNLLYYTEVQGPHVTCSLRWVSKVSWAVRRTGRQLSMDQACDMASGLSTKFSVGRAFPEQQRHSKCLPPFWHEATKMMGICKGWGERRRKAIFLKTSCHIGGNSKERSWQVGVSLSLTQQLVLTPCGNDVLSGRRRMPKLCGLTGHRLRRDRLPFVSHLCLFCIHCFLWLGVKEQKRPF